MTGNATSEYYYIACFQDSIASIFLYHSQGMTGLHLSEPLPVAADPVPFPGIPSARKECFGFCFSCIYLNVLWHMYDSWLMSVYGRDILSRPPQLLATCTAIFDNVLKIDSTKKVSKKLQGTAAGSASWCTNIGNERGEVLVSVLTESEGLEGLRPMATAINQRFV